MKTHTRTHQYRLHTDPSSEAFEFLLCDLFNQDVALRRVLPALRETGYYRGGVAYRNGSGSLYGEVRYQENVVAFSIDATTFTVTQAVSANEHIKRLMERAGAIINRTPSSRYVPMRPGSRRYGTPSTPRSDDAEQLRIEIPDHPWNRALLPSFVALLCGTQEGHVPVAIRPLRDAVDWHIEQTVNSTTGAYHVYVTTTAPLLDWARETLLPILRLYFADAFLYHTAHPMDDGRWVEAVDETIV